MSKWPNEITLEGTYARLEPLSQNHASDLEEASHDGELHKLWYTAIPAPSGVKSEIDRRVGLTNMLPFAVIDKTSGKAIGMTTYMNIEASVKRVEIGSTWYRVSVQRSPINTECKLLLLTHAFENLNCIAVEFRTHYLNVQSRVAIERLGAKLDGILRAHMIMANGTIRDTAVYSIIQCEWPAIKANLIWKLEKPRA